MSRRNFELIMFLFLQERSRFLTARPFGMTGSWSAWQKNRVAEATLKEEETALAN
jgi:hypothetical protein